MLILDVFPQVDLEDILCQVQCVRMICFVHQDGIRIVIDCNIYRPPQCHLDSDGGTAPARKTIYNQILHFFQEARYTLAPAGGWLLSVCSTLSFQLRTSGRTSILL